jgi:5-methyltetrahydropteroyltriglutamate--homocysteine methyltransferase
MKTALEKYWAGKLPQGDLIDVSHTTQAQDWQLQAAAGITRVGIDGTLYDQVLDTTFLLGLSPTRFKDFTGLDLYFAMARGAGGVNAMDLSKFFDTNYHYIVSAGSSHNSSTLYVCRPVIVPCSAQQQSQNCLGGW